MLKWYTCGMWLKMHRQNERESYSHRNRIKTTMVEGINHITTKTFFLVVIGLRPSTVCAFSVAITLPFPLPVNYSIPSA